MTTTSTLSGAALFLGVALFFGSGCVVCEPPQRVVLCQSNGGRVDVGVPDGFAFPSQIELYGAKNCLAPDGSCSVAPWFSMAGSTAPMPDGHPYPDTHSLEVTVNMPFFEGSMTFTLPPTTTTSDGFRVAGVLGVSATDNVDLTPLSGTINATSEPDSLMATFDMLLETPDHQQFSLTNGGASCSRCIAYTQGEVCPSS